MINMNLTSSLPLNNLNNATTTDACRSICEPPNDFNSNQHYISSIRIDSITYKLRCEIVEVHPLTCTKCGSPLELHNGHGKCEYCGTSYSAIMSIVEDK